MTGVICLQPASWQGLRYIIVPGEIREFYWPNSYCINQRIFLIYMAQLQLMKILLPVFCFIFFLPGCKKIVEKAQENALVQAMTSGQWVVTSFVQNSNDITSSFSGYKFQYYSNRTVDAIKNGSVEMTGTWDGDISSMTTWASFTNASAPLNLINGSWHIDNNSWTFVVATQTTSGETKTMRLDKQ